MAATSKLIPISYYDPDASVRLSAYADTVIWEQEAATKTLRAIRFGGYPEMVHALADAIYGGAGIDTEIGGQAVRFLSQTKRYARQLSHDGIYAEATLIALDDDVDAKTTQEEDDEEQTDMEAQPRKCCIFCPENDRERLFEELDRKTAVPLIPEFQEYVLNELERQGSLRRLKVVSLKEKMDAWILTCKANDANIVSIVEDGLRSGQISIPGQVKNPHEFDDVESVTGYLNTFGVTVAERIRNQFQPLFDPAAEPLSPEVLRINDYIRDKAGYSLYDAQLAVTEAVKRQLKKSKCGFIIAECGSGKTKIGSVAMSAALLASSGLGGKKTFNLILCPAHVAKKWTREIAETLPNTVGVVVRNITELNKLYALYEKGNQNVYAIISKEIARDGYMKRPAVTWNRRKNAFLCPSCMKVLEMPFREDGVRYMVNADQFWFHTENKSNHKCPHCGTPLWEPVNTQVKSDWVKIGGYGWIYRYQADEHLRKCKKSNQTNGL